MILVTGGTGLLGSHLLYSLVRDGLPVRAIHRPSSKIEEVKHVFSYYGSEGPELFKKIEWVNADILIRESIDEVMDGVTQAYHAAAIVSFDPRERAKLITANLEGTANIVNACLDHGVQKLCHVSSTAALGSNPTGGPVSEEMMWIPDKSHSGYSISKFKSEMEVWRGIEEGLNAVIVNPSIILGPGFWEKSSSRMFREIYKGLRFYMNGVTGYVWVNDVVNSMRFLMDSAISGERYIVSSENLSYKNVFDMIAAALGVKAPSVEAGPFLAALAWRLDAFRSWFGANRVITRETVNAGRSHNRFSNQKIREVSGIRFRDIQPVIREVAKYFLDDKNEK
jgi:dihydroflavonol-4-reductase